MEQASFACPQIHWACSKKLPEREEQRFHKNPFAVILIVEVLGLSFVCFYLFLWHYFVAGGIVQTVYFSLCQKRLTAFLSSSRNLSWSQLFTLELFLLPLTCYLW